MLLRSVVFCFSLIFVAVDSDRISENVAENDATAETTENENRKSVVVLTSLSGIYLWWPKVFSGDDSFHFLLDQNDVPRFHDVSADQRGNLYLTAPSERSIFQLDFSSNWWKNGMSNQSKINSIRADVPLFINIHLLSSRVFVFGHSDIQLIDLLEKPRSRGSAPFMKRLKELSPNMRITDLIIDQVTSDGFIFGDSFGWCVVIRCALTGSQCDFLFKIPSSSDNRPYSCSGTIDFQRKLIYLSLDEKILVVELNEENHFERRFVLTEKRGFRSSFGFDDIFYHNDVLFYTDALRPLIHFCTSVDRSSCSNISLSSDALPETIFPLRLTAFDVENLRLPETEVEMTNDASELVDVNSTTIIVPLSLIGSNRTNSSRHRVKTNFLTAESNLSSILLLLLGFLMASLLFGLALIIYCLVANRNQFQLKENPTKVKKNRSDKSLEKFTDEESKDDRRLDESFPFRVAIDHEKTSQSDAFDRSTAETESTDYHPNLTL